MQHLHVIFALAFHAGTPAVEGLRFAAEDVDIEEGDSASESLDQHQQSVKNFEAQRDTLLDKPNASPADKSIAKPEFPFGSASNDTRVFPRADDVRDLVPASFSSNIQTSDCESNCEQLTYWTVNVPDQCSWAIPLDSAADPAAKETSDSAHQSRSFFWFLGLGNKEAEVNDEEPKAPIPPKGFPNAKWDERLEGWKLGEGAFNRVFLVWNTPDGNATCEPVVAAWQTALRISHSASDAYDALMTHFMDSYSHNNGLLLPLKVSPRTRASDMDTLPKGMVFPLASGFESWIKSNRGDIDLFDAKEKEGDANEFTEEEVQLIQDAANRRWSCIETVTDKLVGTILRLHQFEGGWSHCDIKPANLMYRNFRSGCPDIELSDLDGLTQDRTTCPIALGTPIMHADPDDGDDDHVTPSLMDWRAAFTTIFAMFNGYRSVIYKVSAVQTGIEFLFRFDIAKRMWLQRQAGGKGWWSAANGAFGPHGDERGLEKSWPEGSPSPRLIEILQAILDASIFHKSKNRSNHTQIEERDLHTQLATLLSMS